MTLNKEHFLDGQPVPKFPLASDLDKPEFIQRYPSLSSLLAARPEPFWQKAAALADTPISKQHSPDENGLLARAGLAIRALDRGMIALLPSKKFVYLYGYLRVDPSLVSSIVYDDKMGELFPLLGSSQYSLMEAQAAENGRFKRFQGYIQALSEIQAAGRPDILLSNNRSNSGTYSEFDFWVESQIRSASTKPLVASTKDLAQKMPPEFNTLIGTSMKERIYWIHYTRQKLTQTYNRLQPVLPTMRERQFARIKTFLIPTETGYQLTLPIEEVSQQLGLSHTNTKALLNHVREVEGITIDVVRPKIIHERTIVDAQHIIEAIEALEKTRQVKWRYGQIPYEDLAAYITEKYPDLGKMTREAVNYIINAYLDSQAIKLPQLPARRFESTNPAEVHNNIKRDILELIHSGHTHNAAQLALTLRIPGVIEDEVPQATVLKVIRMLKELEKEGEVIHWEENSRKGLRRTMRQS